MPFDALLEASRATALAAHSAAGLAASSGEREAARLLLSAEAMARAATAALHEARADRARRGVSADRARGGVAPDAGCPDTPGAVPAATVSGPAPRDAPPEHDDPATGELEMTTEERGFLMCIDEEDGLYVPSRHPTPAEEDAGMFPDSGDPGLTAFMPE